MDYPHGMFLQLPICFALGFAIASIAKAIQSGAKPPDRNALDTAEARVAAYPDDVVDRMLLQEARANRRRDAVDKRRRVSIIAMAVAALGFVLADVFVQARLWDIYFLGEAALAIGGVAGWWFWNANSDRDRAIFAAAATFFLIFAGVQYDTNVIDRITKFGAGGVNLELADNKARSDVFSSVELGAAGAESKSFSPNTERTDNALNDLFNLTKLIIRDVRFAKALSSRSPIDIAIDRALLSELGNQDDIEPFITYGCTRIEPFAAALKALQRVHPSESLAIGPKLIPRLQQSYYTELPIPEQNEPCSGVENAFQCANDWTDFEMRSVFASFKNAYKDNHDMSPVENRNYTSECQSWENQLPNLNDVIPKEVHPAKSEYMSNLAIVLALDESGIGNVESAIQLLDRHIDKLRKEIEGNKETSHFAHFEHRLTLLRLERYEVKIAQDFFLDRMQTAEMGRALVVRLHQITIDIENMLRAIYASDDIKPINAFTRMAPNGDILSTLRFECEIAASEKPEINTNTRAAAAWLAYYDLEARNSMINTVAHKPLLARAFRDILQWSREDVRVMKEFKFDCASRAGVSFKPEVEATVQQSIGAFYEADANGSGSADSDAPNSPSVSEERRVATALCAAAGAYGKAAQLFADAAP